jgi:hypothetical protein
MSRLLGLSLGLALAMSPVAPAFAQWSPALVGSAPRTEAAVAAFGGPQAAQDLGSDIRSLSSVIAERVATDRELTFEQLTHSYPEEVVIGALARLLARGKSATLRGRAAHLLGEAPGHIPTLIMLDEVRRTKSKAVSGAIYKQLGKFGGRGADEPIPESKFLYMLEKISEETRTDAGQYLMPLLNTWPGFRVPIVRAISRINYRDAIPALKTMLGGSDEVDAEIIGALAWFNVDREANRERLARALPRSAELGDKGLGAFQSILFYMHQMALRNRDPLCVKPLVYVIPHAAEPFRTQAMAILHKIAVADPAVFVTGIAQVGTYDRDEIIKDFVAYVYQKDFDQQLLDTFHRAFRDLDLDFPHHDLAQAIIHQTAHQVAPYSAEF